MLTILLLSLVASLAVPVESSQVPLLDEISGSGSLTFALRHVHTTTNTSRILFADVHDPSPSLAESHTLSALRHITHRPLRSNNVSSELIWEEDTVLGPNVTNRHTLLQLAKMTNNAYTNPGDDAWYDLDGKWNNARHFSLYNSFF